MSARIRSFAAPAHGRTHRSAPTGRRGGSRNHPGQRRTAERLRRGWEEGVGIAAEIIPKVSSNFGQSLSHGCAVPAPFAQGSLRGGGYGLPRRPCGPPRNDNGFLSFRGAERRGNPYFYDGRGFGPPYLGHGLRRPNFVPKFGASVKSSAPTGGCGKLPRVPGQRSERGKRSWSNSGFARYP